MIISKSPTFSAAVVADIGWLLRASRGRVTFLHTNTARSFEDTGLGTINLVVSESMCKQS
jgi:hypothetical protein